MGIETLTEMRAGLMERARYLLFSDPEKAAVYREVARLITPCRECGGIPRGVCRSCGARNVR